MKKISPREAAVEMELIFKIGDMESNHIDGDKLMLRILRENGFKKAADIFEAMDKWYA